MYTLVPLLPSLKVLGLQAKSGHQTATEVETMDYYKSTAIYTVQKAETIVIAVAQVHSQNYARNRIFYISDLHLYSSDPAKHRICSCTCGMSCDSMLDADTNTQCAYKVLYYLKSVPIPN